MRDTSIACCTGMPNSAMFRNTCSIACDCTSPPGVPNAMKSLPSLNAREGFGVRRGRLPGATTLGCPGVKRDWQPRPDTAKPRPGMTGVSYCGSDSVAE